jgi:hypothetical protein
LSASPDEVIGGPRPLIDPGRPIEFDAEVGKVMAAGFGLGDVDLVGDPSVVLGALRDIELPGLDLDVTLPTAVIRDHLHQAADRRLVDLVADTLDLGLGDAVDPVIVGPNVPGAILAGGGFGDLVIGNLPIDGGVIDGGVVGGGVVDGGVVGPGGIVAPLADRIRARREELEDRS